MGYYSTVDLIDLKFVSEEKEREFLAVGWRLPNNPLLYKNPEDGTVDKGYEIDIDGTILLNENVIKVPTDNEPPFNMSWIKELAPYLKGRIDVDGEESSDFWRVEYDGEGGVKRYCGEITYKEVDSL